MTDSEKPNPEGEAATITRGDLLKAAAAGTGAVLLGASGAAARTRVGPYPAAAADNPIKGMNVLVFVTDQQRAIQHFPRGWSQRHMPGLDRLQRHGVTSDNACTNACMCSPARSTFLTGYFPAQHGVKYTLESSMPASQYPQVELNTDFKNLGTVTEAAGYTPVYKGKFHCVKPANGSTWQPSDVNQYGFTRWDPPDAGANQSTPEEGGGYYDNDGRFINSQGTPAAGTEGALQYLQGAAAQQQPFFMVVSLVNPHDVLSYPKNFTANGYDDSWLLGDIGLPATVNEDLSTKPTVQKQFLRLFTASGPIPTPQMKRNYLNFYGNLMRSSDAYLMKILDTLVSNGMFENTLVIATSDHGEMGTAHGGMRQKNFNFYEETRSRPARVLEPPPVPEGPDRPLARLPRRLPADAGQPGRSAVQCAQLVARGRLLGHDPRARPEATAGLHRVHLRRLPVGPAERSLPDAAQPRRQHPRAPVQARALLRRQRQRARSVGDVRPADRPDRARQHRLPGAQAHAHAAARIRPPPRQARAGAEDAAAAALSVLRRRVHHAAEPDV